MNFVMRLETTLVREPGEHLIPGEMLAQERTGRGRPKARYRPVVRTPEDVEQLRRRRVPVFLLTDAWVTESGYPVRFRPWLAVSEALAGSVESSFRVLSIRDAAALQSPGLPELVTLLLRFDPLAARAIATRNHQRLDRLELYRRIRNEGLERAATKVRLQELVPAIPMVGEPLPLEDVRWVDENNPPLTENP
jgi:hypothetical protein